MLTGSLTAFKRWPSQGKVSPLITPKEGEGAAICLRSTRRLRSQILPGRIISPKGRRDEKERDYELCKWEQRKRGRASEGAGTNCPDLLSASLLLTSCSKTGALQMSACLSRKQTALSLKAAASKPRPRPLNSLYLLPQGAGKHPGAGYFNTCRVFF